MDGRNIPGYYFDPEKKKYFRIQNSHTAPPSQAKYTKDNVRKQEEKAKAEKSILYRQKKQQKETVVRRHTRDILKSATLDREVGGRRTSSYMHGLWPGACVSGMSTKSAKVCHHMIVQHKSNCSYVSDLLETPARSFLTCIH